MSDFEEFARSQGFSGDFQRGCNGQYKSDLLHFMEKAFMHQQAEIDRLSSVLDERTKEWLQAIECGTYFENVAKPLKEENDSLRVQLSLQRDRNKALEAELTSSRNYGDDLHCQLNNMEACYIEVKKERDELEAAKRDYVCDCGYLDSPDYEECDCRKHSEDLANEVIAEIVKKANFAGLEELLDELKCRAIKHGVLLNKQALRGVND